MSDDVLAIINCVFSETWRLFTSWRLPGLSFTPASFFAFVFVVKVSIVNIIVPLVSGSPSNDFGLVIFKHDGGDSH